MSAFSIEEKYNTEVTLRTGKTIHLRKWKVKDRKNFKNAIEMKGEDLKPIDVAISLVFPCILEKDILLTEEELKYITSVLRSISISEDFDFSFICDSEECNHKTTVPLKVLEVNKPNFQDWSKVDILGGSIVFGEIVKPDFYYKIMSEANSSDDKITSDLASHIISVDGDDSKTFGEMVQFLDNLDTDIIDKIQEEYEKQKFTLDEICEVECEKCKSKQKFIFDEIPGFFPASWFL